MNVRDIGMTFVKCTRFLNVVAVNFRRYGIEGDRQYILLDRGGAPMAPQHHKLFLPLVFGFDPATGRLELTYPDGRRVEGSGAATGPVIRLDYMGMRDIDVRDVEGDWNRLLSEFAGVPVRMVRVVEAGAGIDVLPITFFTTGSLRMLSEKLGAPVDPSRFRANLLIEHDEPFVEDGWEGQLLRVGSALLRVRSPVPRCIVTQYHPGSGVDDLPLVRTLGKFRDRVRLPDGLMPSYATPAFASYADVVEPGLVRAGDAVELLRGRD